MAISLNKGQALNLTKTADNGLSSVMVGLGWDERKKSTKGFFHALFASESNIDCDASAFLLKNGKLESNRDIVYYGRRKHDSGAVNHQGDNLTGAGDGDDEQILIDLNNIPQSYNKVVIVVNIFSAESRRQNFGMIENAFIRIVDNRTNNEICRYNLSNGYDNDTAMVFGELTRENNGEWTFTAIGKGSRAGSIDDLARDYE